MRDLINIINEATLSKSELLKHDGLYLKNLTALVKSGTPLEVAPAAYHEYGKTVVIDKTHFANWLDTMQNKPLVKNPPLDIVDQPEAHGRNVIYLSDLLKSAKIKGKGSDEPTAQKTYNAGHLAELVMGLAVSAKFFNIGNPITVDQLLQMFTFVRLGTHIGSEGKATTNLKFELGREITYPSGKTNPDFLHFVGVIPIGSGREFVEFAKAGKFPADIQALLASAVKFVNESPSVKQATDRVQKDPKKNQINVTSDGISDAKMTKADLVLTIDGSKVNLFSLKTYSTPTIGQMSGLKFETLKDWFKTSFDLDISKYAKNFETDDKKQLVSNVFHLYDDVIYPWVKDRCERQRPSVESEIVKQLARSANLHARGSGLEDVEIVKLDDSTTEGGYQILKFSDSLYEAMKKLDLHVNLNSGSNGRTIQILVRPHETLKRGEIWQNLLCQFRSQLMGGYLRNYFEIGDIMVELTRLPDAEPEDPKTVEPVSRKKRTQSKESVRARRT